MSTRLDMTTVFHARPYGGFIEIKSHLRKKTLYKINQDSNFLSTYLQKRQCENPIKFEREKQSQHLKRLFFVKIRSIHIMSTTVDQSSSVFLALFITTRHLIKLKVESSNISINSNIKDSIIRKVINI